MKMKTKKVTPAVLETIADCILKGLSQRATARKCGIDESTVRYHLENTLRPRWREDARAALHEDLAKVALLERVAWERFESAEPGETREAIKKALLESGVKPRIVEQATTKVTRTGEVAWLQVIQWAIEFRARIFGHYAPTHHRVAMEGQLRVAGMSPSEVDQMMVKKLLERIEERRQHQAALGTGRN